MRELIGALLVALGFALPAQGQADWFVDVNAVGPGDGSVVAPFPTIQAAIDQMPTVAGDRVLVLPGIYFENVDFAGKSVVIQSTNGADVTTIDAGGLGSGVRADSGEGPGTRLRGFSVRNGLAAGGAGVFVRGSFLELQDCSVTGNQATSRGGGIYIDGGFLTLTGSQVLNNDGPEGAGLFASQALVAIEQSQFLFNGNPNAVGGGLRLIATTGWFDGVNASFNVARDGGGLSSLDSTLNLVQSSFNQNAGLLRGGGAYVVGGSFAASDVTFFQNGADQFANGAGLNIDCDDATLTDCAFEENGSIDIFGGGLWAQGNVLVEQCEFRGNVAADGGGAHVGSGVEFVRCLFRNNVAENTECKGTGGRGGGVRVRRGSVGVRIEASVFHDNLALDCAFRQQLGGLGGGIDGPALIERCTLTRNIASLAGGGGHGVDVHDTIVWNNTPDGLAGPASSDYSIVQDMFPGTHTLDQDPVFVRPDQDDFHLALASPCIDSGDPTSPVDPDGSPGDMGALPFCDCNGNGTLDTADIAEGVSADLNGNGFPDECECFTERYCAGAENSTGIGALMELGGSLSFALNDLVLQASRCPANKAGFFFYGAGRVQVAFGDGFRCVGAPILRRPLRVTDANGRATDPLNNTVGAANGRIVSGSTWNFQFWYRDPAGPLGFGFNLTDGISATFCP